MDRGVPHPRFRWEGTPYQIQVGGTPTWTLDRVPPSAGWGIPHLDLGWGTPIHIWDRVPLISWMGYPHLDLGWGAPIKTWDGVLPIQTWDGVPPSGLGMGYPLTWDGFPHQDLGWGTPHQLDGVPPPASVDRHTDSCQNITFPRTSYAGGNYSLAINMCALCVFRILIWKPDFK